MAFSLDNLTMREIELYEEQTGQSIAAFGDPDRPMGKSMRVMYFIARRREEPKFLLKDTEDMTMDQITEGLGLKVEEDPKDEN